jgi:D-glycero-D-manno-heptose 1,7-bisphosphate phosphatase
MGRAIFLDRDGVLTKLVYNPATKEYESPHYEKDLRFCPGIFKPLRDLIAMGYLLFLVSNQPSYAKGKTSLKNIMAIHKKFNTYLVRHGIRFSKYYYCYHHPQGSILRYAFDCECRKPKPFFLLQAKERYRLDMHNSWIIGDRDSDVECGRRAGTRTIRIKRKQLPQRKGVAKVDFFAKNLKEAVKIICVFRKKECEHGNT